MEDKKKIEVSKEELAKAAAIYIAGESGLTEEVSPKEAGRRGAFISDLAEVGKRYVNGEISQEQVEQKIIEKSVTYAFSRIIDNIIDKVLDKGVDVIAELIGRKFPEVEKILKASKSIIKSFVKSKVLNKAKETVSKVWNKAKAWIKSKL